jgi:hypothetical protein
MSSNDEFIQKLDQIWPEILETDDLVKVGLYPSMQAAYYSRKLGRAPEYFEVGKRIFYAKTAVLNWLRSAKRNEKDTQTQKTA